jgi:hypothetical protein
MILKIKTFIVAIIAINTGEILAIKYPAYVDLRLFYLKTNFNR